MIPKIVHQTAYSNKNEWHPIWKHCQQSILNHFKNFKYKFWDDESLDNFVKEKYKVSDEEIPECVNCIKEFFDDAKIEYTGKPFLIRK